MKTLTLVLIGLILSITIVGCNNEVEESITAFCGSASKPAMEEAALAFEQETGIKVYLNFSGSGTMLSKMKLSQSGDVYIPGSPDYMSIAEQNGIIYPETVKVVSYLVPAILVQEGNPENIKTLSDLARPDIDVGIGNPEVVCVGLYAYEIMEQNGLHEEIEDNIVTLAESCSKTATLVALKTVDAILGWRVFSEWHDTLDVVYLEPHQLPRIAYIPAAISTFSKDRENARKFIDFLVSLRGQEYFSKWGYIATEEEARTYAPEAEIGGEYRLPAGYTPPVK